MFVVIYLSIFFFGFAVYLLLLENSYSQPMVIEKLRMKQEKRSGLKVEIKAVLESRE